MYVNAHLSIRASVSVRESLHKLAHVMAPCTQTVRSDGRVICWRWLNYRNQALQRLILICHDQPNYRITDGNRHQAPV